MSFLCLLSYIKERQSNGDIQDIQLNYRTIKLASSDIKDSPLIDSNFFTDPHDLNTMVEGCKLVFNISKTQAMQSVGAEFFDSPLPGCEQYPLDSDDYLRCLMQTDSKYKLFTSK